MPTNKLKSPDSWVYSGVASRIKACREKSGLRQDDLALRVGLSRGSIANIETGRQKMLLHTLIDIARALNVPAVYLFAGVDSSGPDPLRDLEIRTLQEREEENRRMKKWIANAQRVIGLPI
jgi:transcriptional regulator with XRE-family HTH domain